MAKRNRRSRRKRPGGIGERERQARQMPQPAEGDAPTDGVGAETTDAPQGVTHAGPTAVPAAGDAPTETDDVEPAEAARQEAGGPEASIRDGGAGKGAADAGSSRGTGPAVAPTAGGGLDMGVGTGPAAAPPKGDSVGTPFVAPATSAEPARLAMPGTPAVEAPAALSNPKADLAALDELERHLYAHRYARIGIQCHRDSIDPEEAAADSGEALAILEQEDQELLCSPATGELLRRLPRHGHLLNAIQRDQVRILTRDRDALVNVPPDEQAAFTRLTNEATAVWRKAKAADNWRSFAPFLDRIVDAMRSIAGYRRPGADPYDVWLDEFEHGCDRSFYDAFFEQVRQVVVPLVADISKLDRHPSRRPIEGRFDERRQWALASDLMSLEGLRPGSVFLTKTEHPFSDALTSHYAIVAGHVYEDDVCSNIFSILHEGGHALYETGVDPTLDRTSLKGGTSMGMHESQSRFFENYVGHAEAFAPVLLALLRRHFPGQFGRVTLRQFYLATNSAKPGLVRTEADELTYPLHVLVRYELEQLLMSGEAKAADVPRLWAEKYRAYLGVEVPNDTLGALQDVHWSLGCLGYFPTYALGSAFGAQFRAAMVAGGMDFDGVLASGDLAPIRRWLGDRIWYFGRRKDSGELMRESCGAAFDPTFYTDYLQAKFGAIYGL